MNPANQAGGLSVGDGLGFSVLSEIHKAYIVMSRRVEKALKPQGMTLPQLYLLAILSKGGGRLPVGEIAIQTMYSETAITGLADRVEARGWAKRERDSGNRRKVILVLTGAGREKTRAAWRVAVTTLDEICQLVGGCDDRVSALQMRCLQSTCQALREAASASTDRQHRAGSERG